MEGATDFRVSVDVSQRHRPAPPTPKTMRTDPTRSAANFLPAHRDLKSLRAAASHCEGCPLYEHATQTVFGEGKSSARLILVGEQPGDREDIESRPFVGPAGLLL